MYLKKLFIIFFIFAIIGTTACASKNPNENSIFPTKITTAKENSKMKINININNKTDLKATLYDNSSARTLFELLKKGEITINMQDYSNFEKVGDLPISLPRNDVPTNTDAGDLILYLGKRFVIYYDKNNWNFTPLGKIDKITKSELKTILGSGDVTAVLSVSK